MRYFAEIEKVLDARPRVRRVALRAFNGQYVCAENAGGAPLSANRSAIGPWETFEMSMRENNKVSLRACNGLFVCAEGGGDGEVVANRQKVGGWESFELIDKGDNKIALRAFNGKFLSAEPRRGMRRAATDDNSTAG